MRSARPRAVLLVSAACFVLLALAVAVTGAPPGDRAAREALLAFASPPVVAAMRVINVAGSWQVLLPATLLLLWIFWGTRPPWWMWLAFLNVSPVAFLVWIFWGTRPPWWMYLPFLIVSSLAFLVWVFRYARHRWWVWLGLMIAAPATEGILKVVIGRQRPEDASMGFPSGHATAAAAFFGAVIYLAEPLRPSVRRLVRAAAIAVIVLVAVARVILRAHWPSDALAGIALGTAFASAATLLASPRRAVQDR